jgi:hypothetical protein
MIWSEVRKAYPDQWLIIEALLAHTEGNQRLLDRIAVIETCTDGASAMQSYERLHREYPLREFYFVHTGREILDIRERRWIGIRRSDAAYIINGILGMDFLLQTGAIINLRDLSLGFDG